MVGRTLSHYAIVEKLGEGGMGIVYKAHDRRLDRSVAIKVLHPDKVTDSQRKRRFVQEAKAASALNHPNIVTIYDIGSDAGIDFIVMEYVRGRSLEQVIPRHGMQLGDALDCAAAIADALVRAHAAGLVHRDVKPGNVLLGSDGPIKLVDFGLAKLVEDSGEGDVAKTQTVEMDGSLTEDGAILGTAYYMSPEQLQGKRIDARSDVFSFGVVLYEMLTGRKAFQRSSRVATMAAILHEDPQPLRELNRAVPRGIERLVALCLRKDPAKRWQSMADIRTLLLEFKRGSNADAVHAGTRWRGPFPLRATLVIGAMLLVIGAAAALWYVSWRSTPSDAVLRPVPLTSYPGSQKNPSFSPDGGDVAFSWDGEKQDNVDIYLKRIGVPGPALRLTTNPEWDDDPAWSTDGRSIAFLRYSPLEKAAVMLIPALGGPERKLTEVASYGATGWQTLAWSPDSKWLVGFDSPAPEGTGLWLISAETGERRRLTQSPVHMVDTNPVFSPDGRTIAFSRASGPNTGDLYLLSVSADLKPIGEPRRLTRDNHFALWKAWTPNGRDLVFSSGAVVNSLWRTPISGDAKPRSVTEQLANGDFQLAISGRSNRLVFTRQSRELDIYRVELDPTGETRSATPLIASAQFERGPSYSPDGKKIAFVSLRSGAWQLWVADDDGGNPVQLTSFDDGEVGGPSWSTDGRQIRFFHIEGPDHVAYAIDANGGKPQNLKSMPNGDDVQFPPRNASLDGKWRYFARGGAMWSKRPEGGEEKELFKYEGDLSDFEVSRTGICIIVGAGTTKPGEMMFYRFPDGPLTKVMGADHPSPYGASVSPDGRFVLYTRFTAWGAHLMLVENFR